MNRALVAIALAGCGDVSAFQCSSDEDCTDRDGIVGTCSDLGFCAFSDGSCPSGLRYDEQSAGSLSGACVDPGTGPLGDTPDHPRPLLPIQSLDISKAHDDYGNNCQQGDDDLDIFFEVTLDKESRLYVDTFGTDFSAQLSIIDHECATVGDRDPTAQCFQDSCSGQSHLQQYSDILEAGTYCVVVDRSAGDTHTNLVVRSMIGPAAAMGSPGSNDGNTCNADDWTSTCTSGGGPDQTWFFMSCTPTTYIVDACDTFSGTFSGFGLQSKQVSCGDGNAGIDVALTEPGPAWIVAEVASQAECGNVCASITQ